ncbi:MAG TPA: AIPR family protein [Dehalococcoidia bacterium]|nr:AIPR family protein [Dehalococcoidia bacterium]
MRRSEWQPVYEHIRPFIEDAARTHYRPGDLQNGFKFWAVSQALMDLGFSDDEIKQPLTLDGRGDLGLDGYYEDTDTESPSLILIQSRFHGTPTPVGNDELNRFVSSLRKILDPDIVVSARNPLAQDAHRAVREAIAKEWTLRFVFLTSGYLSPEGRAFAEAKRSEGEVIDSIQVRKELEVYDLEGLRDLYQSHLTPTRLNTDVDLQIGPSDLHISTIGNFRVLVAALPARELVKAFRQYGYALFKLNPRGPLQNKVNSGIRKTIEDPLKRKWFFHLNNGITALAENFRVEDGYVSVRDFQIVNGCQTTVTLAKVAPIVESDDDIKVLLKLFEGVTGFKKEIADATNTQARLTAQDKKSNDPLQEDLKRPFNALPAPIFYDVKRGDWQMEQAGGTPQRYLDTTTNIYRRINMVDLAQSVLAFLGEPGRAKDRPRNIFEDESLYTKVFPEGVRPEQLLLPWHVYQQAERLCSEWSQFDGAPYARFCLTAIVGSELAPSKELPSVQEASKLIAQHDRIMSSLNRGQRAVLAAVAALEEYPGHREFFRSADFFGKVLRTYKGMPKE